MIRLEDILLLINSLGTVCLEDDACTSKQLHLNHFIPSWVTNPGDSLHSVLLLLSDGLI